MTFAPLPILLCLALLIGGHDVRAENLGAGESVPLSSEPESTALTQTQANTESEASSQDSLSDSQASATFRAMPARNPENINWAMLILSLLLIVGLIMLIAFIVKRFGGLRMMGGRDMKVVAAMPVGTREKVAVIDVKGQQILVGITPHHISHLHTFDEAVVDTTPSAADSDFAKKLQGLLNQKGTQKHESS